MPYVVKKTQIKTSNREEEEAAGVEEEVVEECRWKEVEAAAEEGEEAFPIPLTVEEAFLMSLTEEGAAGEEAFLNSEEQLLPWQVVVVGS